jgi:hypothetical protein
MPPRERQRPTATGGLTPRPESLMPASTVVADEPEPATAGPAQLVYLSARVPRALRDRLQMQSIREGRPVVKLLTEAVENYLNVHEST